MAQRTPEEVMTAVADATEQVIKEGGVVNEDANEMGPGQNGQADQAGASRGVCAG